MNILLWVVQILLALHTAIGALWKFSHSEQAVPSLKALPHGVWLAMAVFELLLSAALILPAVSKPAAILVPIAAICVAVEMLFFCVLHLQSSDTSDGPLVYWLVVAAVCGFLAYGRFALRPL